MGLAVVTTASLLAACTGVTPGSGNAGTRAVSPTSPVATISVSPGPKRTHEPGHPNRAGGSGNKLPAGVPAVDVPNHRLTPGVAFHVSAAQVCVPGYASKVRDVSEAEKQAVYARYGIVWVPYQHEVDHLVSLEIGGSNDIRNLWPEPYAGRWGARTKDVLENRLHDLVCSGELSLRSAQRQEATNWVAAYRRYVGSPPPSSGGAGGSSSGGYYASSYPTAHTIYCADDPDWRNLSKTYLVHFATLAQARARFPSYHLHQPC